MKSVGRGEQPTKVMHYPTTPDGRYFVVKGRLWRCSNPLLAEPLRASLVQALMKARRAVRDGKRANDPEAVKEARALVEEAKVALGERGPVWWSDGSADYNRRLVKNTPYQSWWTSLPEAEEPSVQAIREEIARFAELRTSKKSFCPSEVARALAENWRPLMPLVREVAAEEVRAGRIVVLQKGEPVNIEQARGPIRLRKS